MQVGHKKIQQGWKNSGCTLKLFFHCKFTPRYAPDGVRSWGPTRALIVEAGTKDANSYVKVLAMIETRYYFKLPNSFLWCKVLSYLPFFPSILGKQSKTLTRSWNSLVWTGLSWAPQTFPSHWAFLQVVHPPSLWWPKQSTRSWKAAKSEASFGLSIVVTRREPAKC